MLQQFDRTVDDVVNMLKYSKQKDEEINPLTQIFYYPKESVCKETKANLRLLVIDEEFIKKLENGERFFFKGSNDEKVVLCTEDETFEVKEGEISNSLIIAPDLLFNSNVKEVEQNERTLKKQEFFGVHHNYLELRLTFPRLSKLNKILQETELYKSIEKELCDDKGYYFYELLDMVQCSRNELTQHLKEIRAICLEGKWRLLSLEYIIEILSEIKFLMEKNKCMEISAKEIQKHLSDTPNYIIDYILQHYTIPVNEKEDLYKFREKIVARSSAELLLKTAEKKFNYNDFMKTWTCYLHPVIDPNLDYLEGLALVEKDNKGEMAISLFPENNLPENIAERFRLLFKRKEKWTLNEITPYIEKLTTKNTNVVTLLTKYTRSSNIKSTKVFSAKYAK